MTCTEVLSDHQIISKRETNNVEDLPSQCFLVQQEKESLTVV